MPNSYHLSARQCVVRDDTCVAIFTPPIDGYYGRTFEHRLPANCPPSLRPYWGKAWRLDGRFSVPRVCGRFGTPDEASAAAQAAVAWLTGEMQ